MRSKKTREETQITQVENPKKIAQKEASVAVNTTNGALEKPDTVEGTGRTITIDTKLYTAQISENGAVLKSLILKKYRETVEKDSPFKELISKDLINGVGRTWLKNQNGNQILKAVYHAETSSEHVEIKENQTITFLWVSTDGITIEKEYRFSPDSYLIGLNLTIKKWNGSSPGRRPCFIH